MWNIGIMQGRLLPAEPGRFQSFPKFGGWQREFPNAVAAGVDYIEWIFDAYGEDVNPLRSEATLGELQTEIARSGMPVTSLCADYFMDFPLLRCTADELATRERTFTGLLSRCAICGIQRVVLPLVDASRMSSTEEQDSMIEILGRLVPAAERAGVEIHLETDLGPCDFAAFLDRIPHPFLRVNYDSGNSASLGYRVDDELAAYGTRVGSVHIKDRVLGGGTVPLGTGNADFPATFRCLREVGYSGNFTLQVARAESGCEVEAAREHLVFARRYIKELQ
jgi:L-ribulose-5-phosphate 3-epimerase